MTTQQLLPADPSQVMGSKKIERRHLAAVLLAAFLGWMFDGLEMGIFPQIARSALSQLVHGADENTIKWWHQVIDACFLFGAAGGGLVFGWLGDRIGRVRTMAVAILVYSVFTGLLYFVTTPFQIAALRFVAALGMGGEWALGVALVMEIWDAKHRPLLAGLIGAAANVGFVLVGLIGLQMPVTATNWRIYAIIGAAPALLTFAIRLFVPESPKWQQAQQVKKSEPLREIFADRELLRRMLLGIGLASVTLLGTWGAVQKIPAWVGGFADRTPSAVANSQIASGIGAILGCLAAPYLAQLLNRRIAYFLLCFGSLISCQILFRYFDHYGFGFLAMVLFVGGITAAVYGWMPLYLPELFPTRIRATAQGVAYNFGRIVAGSGAVWGGTLGGSYARMAVIVSFIYVIGMVLIWFAPETKGRPLPE